MSMKSIQSSSKSRRTPDSTFFFFHQNRPVAEWLRHSADIRETVGSIPIGPIISIYLYYDQVFPIAFKEAIDMVTMFRQGDVLLRKVDDHTNQVVQNTGKEIKDKIILRGETTGHAHRVVGGHLYRAYMDTMFVEAIDSKTKIVHEEHGTIDLPDGWYEVVRQREYDGARDRAVND